MTPVPLRCHLLIGPPGSGKTTLAGQLAPLLHGESGEPGLVLSTDVIRAELFGDAGVQGPWDEIRSLLLQRLREAVAAGRPVIIDATHARRPWRLLYTQHLQLSRPVEWIGWWLTTPLAQCKAWALGRERPVPEAVIEEFHASITHRFFRPDRAEGFATIVALNPAAGEGTSDDDLRARLVGLDRRVRNGLNRQRAVQHQLHRYARLLDLERLLFLIRLLSSFNGLDASDPGTAAALLQICNPLPQGELAERAAAYLASWPELHGGNSDIYADAAAIRGDLAWLEANGFFRLDWQGDQPIALGPEGPPAASGENGGHPALADRQAFRRVFTLLRHILKEPFDAPEGNGTIHRHLLDRLSAIEGAYAAEQEAVLRYDIEHLLGPYGFLPQVKGRPHSRRQGYAIGTALLSADQLLEVHAQLKASLDRLSDQAQKPLLHTLEDRLKRAGILASDGSPGRRHQPKRALANRSFTAEVPGTLSSPEQAARLERAIRDRRRVWLRHQSEGSHFRAWPVQLLFHSISWYLAFETAEIGHSRGLIRCLRVDRLVLVNEDGNARRSSDAEHDDALARLQRLLHVCGGLFFGTSLDDQLAVIQPNGGRSTKHPWGLLRFSCTPAVFQLIREEPHRFPPEHTTFPDANPSGDSHPHPVEIRLPHWTIEQDWDLRAWLFRWGAGIRIEQPASLRGLQLQQAREVVALYGSSSPANEQGLK